MSNFATLTQSLELLDEVVAWVDGVEALSKPIRQWLRLLEKLVQFMLVGEDHHVLLREVHATELLFHECGESAVELLQAALELRAKLWRYLTCILLVDKVEELLPVGLVGGLESASHAFLCFEESVAAARQQRLARRKWLDARQLASPALACITPCHVTDVFAKGLEDRVQVVIA